MCMKNNIKAFTMKNQRPSFSPTALYAGALILALTAVPNAQAQNLCSGIPQRASSFEMSLGSTQVSVAGNAQYHLRGDLAWFARSRSPFRTGIRLGLGHLGQSSMAANANNAENPEQEVVESRYRLAMNTVHGVVRFDPLVGAFRPFLEGEVGVAATAVDRRDFDALGERIGYAVPSLDPTLQYGWSAGARLRLSRTAFLVVRYGAQYGGQLDLHSPSDPEGAFDIADNQHQTGTMGLSFGF